MNKIRAVLSGIILWIMIFSLYTLISFIPLFRQSIILQNSIVFIGVIIFVYFSVLFYFRKGKKISGLMLAILMIITALGLDALVTVPMVMIPQGIGYKIFYATPFLWLMVAEILMFTVLFSQLKANQND